MPASAPQPNPTITDPDASRLGGLVRHDLPLVWPKGMMFLCWFGLGLLTKAPGTLASFGCLPLAAVIAWVFGPIALFLAAVAVFVVGWVFTAMHLRAAPDVKDPQWIVIDEVAGQWATLSIVPLDPVWYLLGFGLFRFFDIVKPWPVSRADRRGTAGGLMLDDALAAVYAGAILWTVRFAWLKVMHG